MPRTHVLVRSLGRLSALLMATAAFACAGPDPAGSDADDACTTDCADADGSTGQVLDDGAGTEPDGESVDDTGDGGGATDLPCEVRDALLEHCMPCHDDPPIYGAPMALRDYADLLVPAASDPTRPVHSLVAQRVLDSDNPMPPSGDMDADDRDALLAWIDAGAPQGSCRTEPDDPEPEPEVGPDALPCEPTVTFTAHAAGSDDAFAIPQFGADNLYQCFTFHSPLATETQATAWAPIVDDERVLHHWILFRTATPQVDGGVGPCAMPGDATFVSGWAPGGENFLMPDDVGLELGGPGDYYILQVHYHNTAQHPDALDRSGVALCTAEQDRPLTAGIVTLGTVGINIPAGAQHHSVQGTCPSWITNYLVEPLHVIASFPHMHELGRSLRTDILRGGVNGPIDTLVEVPHFDFESQEFYPHDPEVMIEPGDAIRTTCTYDNTHDFAVGFGEETEDEMCFNFVMVYPVDAVGEERRCGLL